VSINPIALFGVIGTLVVAHTTMAILATNQKIVSIILKVAPFALIVIQKVALALSQILLLCAARAGTIVLMNV
jgi:hypothetical protein